jgi:hypothetical protein
MWATCLKNTRSPDRARSLAPHWEALIGASLCFVLPPLCRILGLFTPYHLLDHPYHLLVDRSLIGLSARRKSIMKVAREANG